MSEAIFNLGSWKRAFSPALRAFGYVAALYVLMTTVILLPAYILIALGAPSQIYDFAGILVLFTMFFAIFLAFFKVLDEERSGVIPLDLTK